MHTCYKPVISFNHKATVWYKILCNIGGGGCSLTPCFCQLGDCISLMIRCRFIASHRIASHPCTSRISLKSIIQPSSSRLMTSAQVWDHLKQCSSDESQHDDFSRSQHTSWVLNPATLILLILSLDCLNLFIRLKEFTLALLSNVPNQIYKFHTFPPIVHREVQCIWRRIHVGFSEVHNQPVMICMIFTGQRRLLFSLLLRPLQNLMHI